MNSNKLSQRATTRYNLDTYAVQVLAMHQRGGMMWACLNNNRLQLLQENDLTLEERMNLKVLSILIPSVLDENGNSYPPDLVRYVTKWLLQDQNTEVLAVMLHVTSIKQTLKFITEYNEGDMLWNSLNNSLTELVDEYNLSIAFKHNLINIMTLHQAELDGIMEAWFYPTPEIKPQPKEEKKEAAKTQSYKPVNIVLTVLNDESDTELLVSTIVRMKNTLTEGCGVKGCKHCVGGLDFVNVENHDDVSYDASKRKEFVAKVANELLTAVNEKMKASYTMDDVQVVVAVIMAG